MEASLLHICAENNHLECAKTLVKQGAVIVAKAGFDINGFEDKRQFSILLINMIILV
jgi:hypothetical protein